MATSGTSKVMQKPPSQLRMRTEMATLSAKHTLSAAWNAT